MNRKRTEHSIGMKVKNLFNTPLEDKGTITERGYFNENSEECFRVKWNKTPSKNSTWFHSKFLEIIKPQSLKDLLE